MRRETQISALVSTTTRDLLNKYVRQAGIKKGYLVEQALLHHLQALDNLPAEYVIHPRLTVSRQTGEEILRAAASAEPTPALRRLLHDGD